MYFKSVEDTQMYLEQKQNSLGIDLGLGRMERACGLLGNPEKQLRAIHYAGSNGKGSTLHYNQEILISQGYSVASYTSPAQQFVYDQIELNGAAMTAEVFVHEMNALIGQIGLSNQLTAYELTTLLAFQYFAKVNCDFTLIEVGMGGRFDATNVVQPILSVITTISLEHTQFLGDTIAQIAEEKAGIIKAATPVVVGHVSDEVKTVIRDVATGKQAPCFIFGEAFWASRNVTGFDDSHVLRGSGKPDQAVPVQKSVLQDGACMEEETTREVFTFYLDDQPRYKQLSIQMVGLHQIENAAVAMMVCEQLERIRRIKISEQAKRDGLAHAKWAGRFELVSKQPIILLDGAHNADGVKVFVQSLQDHYPQFTYKIVFSCFKDKDFGRMIAQLDGVASSLIFTEMNHPRSARAAELFAVSNHEQKAIQLDYQAIVSESLASNELLAIVGSLQLIKAFRPFISCDCLCNLGSRE